MVTFLALWSLVTALVPLLAAQPVAAATDEATLALNRINEWRAALGIPPLSRHPALDAAAQAHAEYYQLNFGDPSLAGLGLHREEPGKPGFTGETMIDRARAQGYIGSVNENIGFTGSLLLSVEVFMATVNHRLPLIDPRYQHIGFGAVNRNGVRIEVLMVGTLNDWTEQGDPDWVVWPPDGTSGVGTHFWGEAPNPFPRAQYPLGYPVTAKYFGPGTVAFTRGSLFEENREIPVHFATGSGWLSQRTALLAATEPLDAGVTYRYVIEGTIDSRPFQITGSFRTARSADEELRFSAPSVPIPPGLSQAPPKVQDLWQTIDGPVAAGRSGSWTFGPDAWAVRWEPYADSPGGRRQVVYLDKARLEVNDPRADASSEWFVTSGLLAREMLLGQVQVGDHRFVDRAPAEVPLAGDPAPSNPDAPTYASLRPHSALVTGVARSDRTGEAIREVLRQDGTVVVDPARERPGVEYAGYDPVTGHNSARPFTEWLATRPWNSLFVVGRPIAEPYWILVRVSGQPRWVLVQAFERRVLTYTPDNPVGWQVEMGNVGRQYYEWRYGEAPPAAP
ncbi:CAP domain-containing protein [Thermomicrobium sp. 4228-Ro]|uniref:CAP domain-containing protein n=1 Tax=Thermomicrobium sp. 4228-Ro TaxID=2993937 RepID=UPI002248E08C|nr:CAP domain-containing protein [Thermomicrobium sp. 4228-Ro]MCX2727212.1 CAP domain-containing protein [Thermomicrobium sp. 4228-Ro]